MNVVYTLQNKGSHNIGERRLLYGCVVYTLQNKGSHNHTVVSLWKEQLYIPFKIRAVTTNYHQSDLIERVVYTLQNKGSHNALKKAKNGQKVVYTLQNKGSHNR